MARRSYGTGSLFTHRGKWYGQWLVGGRLVKRAIGPKREPGTRHGLTKGQAEAELRRRMQEVRSAPPGEHLTLEEAGERYVRHVEVVLDRKPTTISDYRSHSRAASAGRGGSRRPSDPWRRPLPSSQTSLPAPPLSVSKLRCKKGYKKVKRHGKHKCVKKKIAYVPPAPLALTESEVRTQVNQQANQYCLGRNPPLTVTPRPLASTPESTSTTPVRSRATRSRPTAGPATDGTTTFGSDGWDCLLVSTPL